jgi:hypothetical protein
MLLIRETMYCKPGKVRPLLEKFKRMAALMERTGMGKMRILTDVSADRYWTLVAEFEAESVDEFMRMNETPPQGSDAQEFEAIMKGYHDLVDHGRREIYKIEH